MRLALPLLAGLAACSDYDVYRSDLAAAAETGEIVLDEGGAVRIVARLEADGTALGANPTGYLETTVFAVAEGGSPRVYLELGPEATDAGIAPTAFLELVMNDPFGPCEGGEADAVTAAPRADGGCVVEIPADVRVEGGTVSFQLDAYAQLNFGTREPPGTLEVSVYRLE